MTPGQWIILMFCVFAMPGIAAIAAVITATRLRRQHERDP